MNLRANYSKRIRLSLAFSIVAMTVCAQSIWNAEHLEQVKKSLNQPAYNATYLNLLKQADKALNAHHLSVMMKDKTPPSGDKHDYLSQARYFWPDPTKPDGKPYISRDGVSNPELDKLDRNRLGEMANNVTTLALAWYFSGKEQYALKATKQIRVWFLDKKTCMNPHLKYAQVAPGHNNDLGRCYGVIDTYSLVEMLDAVQLPGAAVELTHEMPDLAHVGRCGLVRTFAHEDIEVDLGALLLVFVDHAQELGIDQEDLGLAGFGLFGQLLARRPGRLCRPAGARHP